MREKNVNTHSLAFLSIFTSFHLCAGGYNTEKVLLYFIICLFQDLHHFMSPFSVLTANSGRVCAGIPRASENSATTTTISNHYLICVLRPTVWPSGVHPALIMRSTSLSAGLICISLCHYLMNLMILWGERLFASRGSWYQARYRPCWGCGRRCHDSR